MFPEQSRSRWQLLVRQSVTPRSRRRNFHWKSEGILASFSVRAAAASRLPKNNLAIGFPETPEREASIRFLPRLTEDCRRSFRCCSTYTDSRTLSRRAVHLPRTRSFTGRNI